MYRGFSSSKLMGCFTLVSALSFSSLMHAEKSASEPTTAQIAAEQELSKKIHEKIGSGFDYDQVSVEINKGVVTLSGTVKTTKDKDQVEKDARSVAGVKELKNEIKINTNKGK
jgi:osmotically-inducible protein OsmY